VNQLLASPFFMLFIIVAVGATVGALRVRGVGLGAAAVFFVALVLGITLSGAGFQWSLPHELTELGLVLFVYALGLHTGPCFFDTLRKRGLVFIAVGAGATLVGAVATIGLSRLLSLPSHRAAASQLADCDAAAGGVASVYRAALIAKILLAPLIFLILRLLTET
jgi:putative transport protein